MTTPIKTQVLNAIEATISNIAEIKQVIRNPSKPIDRDSTVFPVTFVFDDREERSRKNRLAVGTLSVHVETWVIDDGDNSMGDAMDIIQAEIHAVMSGAADVIRLTIKIEESSVEKMFINEDMGVIVMIYDITYPHKWGNAYKLNP